MFNRLKHVPPLIAVPAQIRARRYNRVRLALIRLENPIRFALTGLRHLHMILDDDSWVCVDASLNELPIVAWLDFDVRDRSSLHLPIQCRCLHYHAHADLITDRTLNAMDEVLERRLRGIHARR